MNARQITNRKDQKECEFQKESGESSSEKVIRQNSSLHAVTKEEVSHARGLNTDVTNVTNVSNVSNENGNPGLEPLSSEAPQN